MAKEKTFTVRVTEIFEKDIEVNSTSASDALIKAKEMYDSIEVTLFNEDTYAGTRFRIKGSRPVPHIKAPKHFKRTGNDQNI